MNSIAEEILKDMPEPEDTRHPWELSKWKKLWATSNVDRGKFGEDWVIKYLTQKGYKVERAAGTKHHSEKKDKGCDLMVNEDIRVEVKLGFTHLMKKSISRPQRTLVLDGTAWFHLLEGTADVYALIGINPDEDMEYHVRKGWRTDHESSYLLFITQKIFKEWVEKRHLWQKYDQWSTSASTMKKINYGLDYREFPYS